MHLKNGQTAAYIRFVNHNLTVKTTGTQQCRVEDIRAVGGRDDDNAFIGGKTIHLNEQLVKCLLTFIVTAAHASTTLAAYGVNFVNEDDTGRIFLGLIKKVTHTGGTDTYEHLHEVGAGNGEEGHACLAGYGTGQQGFTCARRAKEQYAFGNPCPQVIVLLRVFQELDHFFQFLLGLIGTGYILEVDLNLISTAHTGTAFAEGHHPAAAALSLLHDEEPNAYQQQNRQQGREHRRPPWRFRRIFRVYLHALSRQLVKEFRVSVGIVRGNSGKLRTISQRTANRILNEDNLSYFAFIHLLQELRVPYFLLCCVPCRKIINDGNSHQYYQQVKPYIA